MTPFGKRNGTALLAVVVAIDVFATFLLGAVGLFFDRDASRLVVILAITSVLLVILLGAFAGVGPSRRSSREGYKEERFLSNVPTPIGSLLVIFLVSSLYSAALVYAPSWKLRGALIGAGLLSSVLIWISRVMWHRRVVVGLLVALGAQQWLCKVAFAGDGTINGHSGWVRSSLAFANENDLLILFGTIAIAMVILVWGDIEARSAFGG